MIYDPTRHARLLTDYCLNVQPGERLLIAGTLDSAPLLREVTREMLGRGARPVPRLEYPEFQDDLAALASDAVLDAFHPAEAQDLEALDGSLRLLSAEPPVTAVRPGAPAWAPHGRRWRASGSGASGA